MSTKSNNFEYVVDVLSEKNGGQIQSFSTLKIIKLLFFVSAVSAEIDKESSLLSIFNRFVAMPYGPVESDVYSCISNNRLTKYNINASGCVIIDDENQLDVSDENKILIQNSIELLLSKNKDIILYTPFQLVDLSHKWTCWQICFDIARQQNKSSLNMPTDSIINSIKYYKLSI